MFGVKRLKKRKEVPTYIELTNKDGLKVIFSNLGASIFAIFFDNQLMTVTPRRKSDFNHEEIYHGKTIGPISGRIKKGKLFIKDKEYNYPINEGQNTLHSGISGLSNQIFDYEMINDGVVFKYDNEDAEYIVTYEIQGTVLKLSFLVKPHRPIPLALTNHSYFSLGDKDISHLKLKANASKYIKVNPCDLVPEIVKDVPPFLDFRKGRDFIRDIEHSYLQDSHTKGYDHSLLLDNDDPIVIENKNYKLTILSDFNALQIYTDNYKNNVKMKGTSEDIHRGVAIEPQDNQLERKIYNDIYQRYIEYRFEKK